MEQLYVFGTGNATVTHCYNTCFALKNPEGQFFMVDTGGGNGILRILEDMKVEIRDIHHIFITHEHTDHILGIVWMVRVIATQMKKGHYDGDLKIYCHEGLVEPITTICRLTLQGKFFQMIGDRIHLIPVSDGECRTILNYPVTFFDIHSTKAKQYGFTTLLEDGTRLTCAGDEPYNSDCATYVEGSDWLLHEAFCLYSQRDTFQPYEKHHSTVKDACELAEQLHIPNLVLWHTEDKSYNRRKHLYLTEGSAYYHGNLLVPDDEEILTL
ncbi:MAG: MBL fold metallo-hydrolase [Hungatella sp.]